MNYTLHIIRAVMLPFPAHFSVAACSFPASLFTGMLVVITLTSNKYFGLVDIAGLAAAEYSSRKMGAASSTAICSVHGLRISEIYFLQ